MNVWDRIGSDICVEIVASMEESVENIVVMSSSSTIFKY